MNERENIIKIAMEAKWRDMFGDHHGICEPIAEAIADSLIANGYGNVAELKVELRSKVDYIHELWEVKEDYKHRAENAERAVREFSVQTGCHSCPFKGRCGISCPDARNDYQDCYEAILRVSAREIEEEERR